MSTLYSCLSAKTSQPAIIIPSESTPIILSHQQLLDQVISFQKKLAAVGISPKEAVGIALPNSLEFVIAFLAVALQRAICAPLNPAYKRDEFEFYFEDLTAPLVLVPRSAIRGNGEVIKAARKCNVAIAEVYWNGSEVCLEVGENDGLRVKKRAGFHEPEPEDVALILHTSGTTGRPKAVPLSHRNLCQTMTNIQATYDLSSSDRTYLVMPLFHVHGLLAGFLAPLMSGGSVIVPARFSAKDFWRDFVAHSANWYTAVPTMHQILLKNDMPNPMPKIRFVRSCSSPLSPTVHKQLETLMGAPVLEAYAMTEAAHQMTSNPLPPASRKPGSVGKPQGVELTIMNDSGMPLSQGRIGEVCIKGPNVTSGYIGEGIASPFFQSGHFRTGDQGYLDPEGYLFLTGRIKELINKGGEKISPIEIDNTLAQHPYIAEAVSFAIDDELYGQNVAVAICLKEGKSLTADELLQWYGERAAKFKIPKKVYFTQNMPKTATGKVQRRHVASAMIASEKQQESHFPRESPVVSPSLAPTEKDDYYFDSTDFLPKQAAPARSSKSGGRSLISCVSSIFKSCVSSVRGGGSKVKTAR
ncbi:acetyl-CoA synthetase-like protein [Pleomassaria siparia CBS 279.74]|uniref:Acetyl-CoA synthetase-like protein n=1 Tax=Pleomassaria siparia CBS 279.74 TaxID=1314801 RepID=A0A6G1K1Y1_9PLEO|nr:acetyl-CoA synthetase-like protein [Pleomassaria siparia CBS 279.74]